MTWRTLIIRPINICNGVCTGCPGLTSSSGGVYTLSKHSLEKLLKIIEPNMFNEAIVLCPNPLQHPEIEYIISSLRSYATKVCLFLPVNHLRSLRRNVIALTDEIVIVTTSYEHLTKEEGYIRSFLSLGVENLSVYFAIVDSSVNLVSLLATISFCRDYGIRLRIGEIPYFTTQILNLQGFFRSRGYKVSLPYGYMYGYRAITAYINNYRVVLLEKPVYEECRKVYVDFYGRVYKCPFLSKYIDIVENLTLDSIRRIIYSKCPTKCGVKEYIPLISISLVTSDGKMISSDILELLEMIHYTRSLRRACSLLGYSPSTCLEKIRSIERQLGFKLITSQRGGYSRGLTVLTYEAIRILEKYKAVREDVLKYFVEKNIRLFSPYTK